MQKVKLSIRELRERFIAEGADAISIDIFFEVAMKRIDIWKEFERLALIVWGTGRRRYSAQTIMHVIRWDSEIERGQGEFDINNNWIAYYSRMFMYQYPEAEGFFETRNFKDKTNGNEIRPNGEIHNTRAYYVPTDIRDGDADSSSEDRQGTKQVSLLPS